MSQDKTQPGVSVDRNTWTRFKNTTDNASRQLEALMQWFMDGNGHTDEDDIDEEIQKLKNEIQDIEEQIDDLQAERKEKRNRISTLEGMKETVGLPENHGEYMDNAFQTIVEDADDRKDTPAERFRQYSGGQHKKYCQNVEDVDFDEWRDRFRDKLDDEDVDPEEVI